MSQSNSCRWGILSAAAIARKNWKSILLSGNGSVTAVASRSLNRAQQFIEECNREVSSPCPVAAVESYEDLLSRDDVDAVYVPLPTGIRKEWVLKAAKAGKHVLCEKPVAINADDAQEMIAACRDAGVQFMDGVMFDHSTRMDGLRDTIADAATFGTLRRIQTHFSFCGDESFEESNIRASTGLEPHGCLGDLGWYCIRFTIGMMDGQLPTHVAARTLRSVGATVNPDGSESGGVPGEFSGELYFESGATAGFYCSFLSSNQQTATISGDRGYVTVDDFVLPLRGGRLPWQLHRHDLQIDNCRWNFVRRTHDRGVDEFDSGESNAQEVNMIRRMNEIVLSNQLEASLAEISLGTQLVLDACRRSDAHDGARIGL